MIITQTQFKTLATKKDLKTLEVSMKGDLKALESATKNDLKDLEKRIESKFATKQDLKDLEKRMENQIDTLAIEVLKIHTLLEEKFELLSQGIERIMQFLNREDTAHKREHQLIREALNLP